MFLFIRSKYMSRKQTLTIIITLAALAALMYANMQFFPKPLPPRPTPIPSSSPTPYVRVLTPDEETVLKVPLHNASSEEKATHAEEVKKLVQNAQSLDITKCMPTPLVYPVTLNGSFKVTNNDSIPHSIRYQGSQIKIAAYSTTTVKTSQLFKTTGDYGYGCDNPFATQGVFMVR